MIFTSSLPIESRHEIVDMGDLSIVIGDPSRLRFAPGSTITIHSWGRFPFSSMEFMFNECDVTLCKGSPVFAPGCSLKGTFFRCANFNQMFMWNVSNVTNMSFMFYGCRSFSRMLLWDTSNVTDMSYMFDGCNSLKWPTNMDTSNVKSMVRMFAGCSSMVEMPVFDTSKVTDMRDMLLGCDKELSISYLSENEPLYDSHPGY